MHYPCHRYHRSGATRVIQNPDQEPQGADWADKPWPPLVVPVKLAACCEALAKKFDKEFQRVVTERDLLRVERDAALLERDGAVMDLETLQRALEAQKAEEAIAPAEAETAKQEAPAPRPGRSGGAKFAKVPTPAEA